MLTFGDYTLLENIGHGEYSTVYRARHIKMNSNSHNFVALKIIDKAKVVESEIEVMKFLNHQNIISLFEVIEENNKVGIVMEYAEKGSIQKNMPLGNIKIVFKYFMQICAALSYLHNEAGVIHRDLKSDNILINKSHMIKLADFGFSKKRSEITSTRCGSPLHISPELVKGDEYDEKTDIWSLGIILYFMVTGSYPFISDNIQVLYKQIVEDELKFPELQKIDPFLQELISQMLSKDPANRPYINEVMEHPWFTKMKSTAAYVFQICSLPSMTGPRTERKNNQLFMPRHAIRRDLSHDCTMNSKLIINPRDYRNSTDILLTEQENLCSPDNTEDESTEPIRLERISLMKRNSGLDQSQESYQPFYSRPSRSKNMFLREHKIMPVSMLMNTCAKRTNAIRNVMIMKQNVVK